MSRYPAQLRRDAGTVLTLDPTRLLLAFREPQPRDALAPRLAQLGLDLEPNTGDVNGVGEVVNHTDRRFWVRSPLGPAIGELYDLVEAALDEQLEWIGPVYHHPDVPGRAGLHCPVPDALVVKESHGELGLREDVSKSRNLPGFRFYSIDEPRTKSAQQVRAELLEGGLRDRDAVVTENMPLLVPLSFEPVDTLYPPGPGYGGQWNMNRIAAGGPGWTAWDITLGSSAVTIAVLDSGCDLRHPDLRFVDGWEPTASGGAAWGLGGNNPALSGFAAGHGTMVAGVAAGIAHNLKGVAGVAGGCKIMPLAFQNFTETEFAEALTAAIETYPNVRVINMSFGAGVWNPAIPNYMIETAHNVYNIVMCAAAGNSNFDLVDYPARHPDVIAVGATDATDNRAAFSSFGRGLSVMAPGTNIPTTMLQGAGIPGLDIAPDYVTGFWGTSAAAPHVSGLAALLFSRHPELTSDEVRNMIQSTCDKVGDGIYTAAGGWDWVMGYGRINALRALQFAG